MPTAQALVDTYARAGGTVLEVAAPAPFVPGSPAAEAPHESAPACDVLHELTIPSQIAVLARVGGCGTAAGGSGVPGGASPNHGRRALLGAVDLLLERSGLPSLDVLVLDGFDAYTPVEETASAVRTLLDNGAVGYVACAGMSAWQIACLRGAGIPVVAALTEMSLVVRSDRTARSDRSALLEAAEYMGIGLVAGAALGRGVLTGRYLKGTPQDSRMGLGPDSVHAAWTAEHLGGSTDAIVKGVARAAGGLGVEPLDVALAWNRSLPVASSLVGPRTVDQLERVLDSDLDLEPEIRRALDEISLPG